MQERAYQADLEAQIYTQWQYVRNVLARLDTGGGKCLGRGTPVLMFDGSIKAVEDVVAGDQLMGPDSRPRRVLSTCSGRENLYRVVPTKGTPYVVNESHILSLQTTSSIAVRRYASDRSAGEVVNLSVREYLAKSDRWKHLHKGWRTGVDFPEKTYAEAMPPYFLGVWLGDGTSSGPAVTTADQEMVEYLFEHFAAQSLSPRVDMAGGRSMTVTATSGTGLGKRHGRNPIRNALNNLGLMGNKHIPLAYKTGSIVQRREVLAGLMDTDGYYTGKGFDYISVLRNLADDVAYVARSLGLAAYVVSAMKSCNGGEKAQYWRVSISGDVDQIPCRIPHKRAAPRLQKKSVLRTGLRLEALGEGDYFGFELDGDRLFMLGDFTVTHNTFILSRIVGRHNGASCTIAHRQELVAQLSQALARNGVRHNLIASDAVKRAIIAEHMAEFGRSFFDPGSKHAVASVDTLIRAKGLAAWAAQVTLVVIDETHHLVLDNKWHTALLLFTNPSLHVLGLTATPSRADGQGLGEGQDGIYQSMVQGPLMHWLIEQGYLTDYEVVCPESDMVLLEDDIGAGGDWSAAKLRDAARASHIVGDVVAKYKEFTAGGPAVTFCPDTETASDICAAYNAAGIRAHLLTGKTDGGVRRATLRKLAAGEVEQLVVVDIVSEGFDLPALITGSMARKSNSLALFMQQLGRLLRPMYAPGYDLNTQTGRLAAIAAGPKPKARLIDHVGNFLRHGPPDRDRPWTLARRDKRAKQNTDAILMRVCSGVPDAPGCFRPYEAFLDACPYCGVAPPPPVARTAPSMVDGVMRLLDAETIAKLRGAVEERDLSPMVYAERMAATGMPAIGVKGHTNNHVAAQAAQHALRQVMALWGGARHAAGRSDSEMQREFFMRFGTSVLEAQALGRADAEALTQRIGATL